MLWFLYDQGIIDAQQRFNGQIYELWQTCFRAKLGYKTNAIYSAAVSGGGAAEYHDGDFARLIFRLQAKTANLIERAISTTADRHQQFLARQNARQYQRAFERLGVVMEELQAEREAREQEINACAGDQFR